MGVYDFIWEQPDHAIIIEKGAGRWFRAWLVKTKGVARIPDKWIVCGTGRSVREATEALTSELQMLAYRLEKSLCWMNQ